MAEVNPCGFLQNAGNVHTAEVTRLGATSGFSGVSTAAGLRNFGGVHPHLGTQLKVQQAGSPNMSVDVLSGVVYIPGTEGSKQGVYACMNDATKNVTIAAADPTNPRIDLIVFKVQDSFYSGAPNTSSIVAVTGTPAGSPSAPAAPANAFILAQVAVAAADTSITNGEITDKRTYVSGLGGIIQATSLIRPTWVTATVGLNQLIFETDTNRVRKWNGTTWVLVPALSSTQFQTATVVTSQTTASTSYTDLATVGPSVTLETGTSVLVHLVTSITNTGATWSHMSFAVSGATTQAASDLNSVKLHTQSAEYRFGGTFPVTGLTPGQNTFTAKYRVTGNTGGWADRMITVDPQ